MKKTASQKESSVSTATGPLNRRSFLKGAATAAAGIAAGPMILPRSVLGMDGQGGANDRIVVACIGHGRQGRNVANAVNRQEDATVAVRVDVHKDRGEVQDYRTVLERKDIDAVIIATPEPWKAIIGIHAAMAGKHIYTEKPLTYTIAEGRKVVEATRRYNVVHQTGSQQRSMNDNYRACMLIRNGALGRVKKVKVKNYPSPMEHALSGGPAPDDLDWERWCGPAPLVPYHPDVFRPRANPGWLSFRQFSGGEAGGWGSHGLDQVQWALGMDESGPVEIWGQGEPFEPWVVKEPRGGRFEGPQTPRVFMRFDDGQDGIELESVDDAPMGGAVFIGEKGTMRVDRASLRSDPPELAVVRPEELEAMDVQLGRSTNHHRNWLDCIKSGEKPVADVEVGHRSATLCHLFNIARWAGRRLQWDPVKEEFKDVPEANRTYLDYERRTGYELPTFG